MRRCFAKESIPMQKTAILTIIIMNLFILPSKINCFSTYFTAKIYSLRWCKMLATRFMATSKSAFISHSQMTITCHPIFSNDSRWNVSFTLFLLNLTSQKSVRVLGTKAYLHPSWWCQKQPFTKMTVLYLGSTTSGFPGYRGSFSENGIHAEKASCVPALQVLCLSLWPDSYSSCDAL